MIRVFDFRQWWKEKHDKDQLEVMSHIDFSPVQGYMYLYVADVNEEDEIMLKLLGCTVDHTIHTGGQITDDMARVLYKSGEYYLIVQISY